MPPAIKASDKERILRVFAAQRANQAAVAAGTPKQRKLKLDLLLRWVDSHHADIHAALHADLRKPASEADLTEILPVTTEIKHARRHLARWMRAKRVAPTLAMASARAWVRPEPRGVLLIITPWNFPFTLALSALVSAIAAGNCVCLKPSEISPHSARLLARMLGELFAEDEVAVFEGDHLTAEELLRQPFDHIFFTGGTSKGRLVMRAAAEHLSTITLELGGKSPVIVDESADIVDAAKKLVWAKFLNAGQTCIAPDYVIAHVSVYGKLVWQMGEVIRKTYGADPAARRASPDYARIVSPAHFARCEQLLTASLMNGARATIGGEVDAADRYIAPTILVEMAEDDAVMTEEIFGPILPVLSYTLLPDALQKINQRSKPLALYIFSRNRRNIEQITASTSAGGTCINDAVLHFMHPNLPFGGLNHSGTGSAHGVYGFRAFSHERAFLRQGPLAPMKLLFPPYTAAVRRLVKLALRWL